MREKFDKKAYFNDFENHVKIIRSSQVRQIKRTIFIFDILKLQILIVCIIYIRRKLNFSDFKWLNVKIF